MAAHDAGSITTHLAPAKTPQHADGAVEVMMLAQSAKLQPASVATKTPPNAAQSAAATVTHVAVGPPGPGIAAQHAPGAVVEP